MLETPEPYATGLLDTGDGNSVYWETVGNPDGIPVLMVHGGPGSGFRPRSRRVADPERYRIIIFDQRNCGRSRPHASDPAVDMSRNTTQLLIRDMEQLREHLGVDRWLLRGASWDRHSAWPTPRPTRTGSAGCCWSRSPRAGGRN